MARNRNNAAQGEKVDLYAYFYKEGELTEPSSIGNVMISNRFGEIESIVASDITSLGGGIKRLSYNVDKNADLSIYTDAWKDIVYETGEDPVDIGMNFNVRNSVWEVKNSLSIDKLSIIAENSDKIKLGENKWIKFDIKEANNNLSNTDRISLLLKDFNGSNVYLSSIAINDYMSGYYKFNSSKLRDDFPEFINRVDTYQWILKVEYNGKVYQPDPINFKFSET